MNKSLIKNTIGSKIAVFIFVLLCGVSFLQGASSVYAADPVKLDDNLAGSSKDKPLITCGNGEDSKDACDFADLIGLIQNGLKLVFALAAFIATAMFIYAGFLMLTAVGNMNQITKAKTIFTRSVVGFLIMFMAFLLVNNLLKNLKLEKNAQDVINNVVKPQ